MRIGLFANSAKDGMSGYGATRRSMTGGACLLCPGNSDLDLFRYGKGVIDINAEIPDGAFDLGVAEQELHSAQITGSSVDQG